MWDKLKLYKRELQKLIQNLPPMMLDLCQLCHPVVSVFVRPFMIVTFKLLGSKLKRKIGRFLVGLTRLLICARDSHLDLDREKHSETIGYCADNKFESPKTLPNLNQPTQILTLQKVIFWIRSFISGERISWLKTTRAWFMSRAFRNDSIKKDK